MKLSKENNVSSKCQVFSKTSAAVNTLMKSLPDRYIPCGVRITAWGRSRAAVCFC